MPLKLEVSLIPSIGPIKKLKGRSRREEGLVRLRSQFPRFRYAVVGQGWAEALSGEDCGKEASSGQTGRKQATARDEGQDVPNNLLPLLPWFHL
jgi:hypothetical protein